ncbi:ABC transporter ATP-binding protein [Gimesia chilikensis]|jgi:putative ABC transport system ATP-binding protein|uniref:Lipoprotein-releasing system ATP-binding protein LolD n=1 Tax=Gimesia chilikensis TaxID=2605989 RepID=A0A517PGS3_9PLAN|nr:ABC transporter ATP-binding protein [Gimesia chilikensis]QDT18576.1 Lipoprotein-releasing system ATP-binding protein LolD [Gimesia chilikensis]QDT82704.1 Lipoprotein-releasing system ATP-binding protein LolD [Gimesia chilikensis]QDU00647.1 Lipoprotein-releasing system ATP-binding protein LolD [Gimesia chilikensis]
MSLLLENVKKSYREPDGSTLPILDIERFEVKEQEQVVLIGESGSGKSTLLNVISGITTADSGKVTIAGTEIASMPEVVRDRFRAERIGFVFQTFNLLPAFSALENVLLGMSFSRKKASRDRAKELLALVGLEHRLNHRPKQMSVGEQQRVAVARALANQPKLLLADEPTANVDVGNQETILKLLRDACTQHQIAMLLVTHSQEVASQFERVETLSDFNKAIVTT